MFLEKDKNPMTIILLNIAADKNNDNNHEKRKNYSIRSIFGKSNLLQFSYQEI